MFNMFQLGFGMLKNWIETVCNQANGDQHIALVGDVSAILADRDFDWDDISSYELDFKGYAAQTGPQGGGSSEWLPLVGPHDLQYDTQTLNYEFAYDSGGSGADTKKTAYYIVWWGYSSGIGNLLWCIWELPTPKTFNADGDTFSWNITMNGINEQDVP